MEYEQQTTFQPIKMFCLHFQLCSYSVTCAVSAKDTDNYLNFLCKGFGVVYLHLTLHRSSSVKDLGAHLTCHDYVVTVGAECYKKLGFVICNVKDFLRFCSYTNCLLDW